MSVKISPSLMCMDITSFKEQISALNLEVDFYHVDIMDGHFVPNIALSVDFIKQLKTITSIPVDAHLMTTNPEHYIDNLIELDTEIISLHAEVINGKAFRLIDKIKSAQKKVGIVLNPETSMDSISLYLSNIDILTIMTVDPGFAGQPFIPEILSKIREAKEIREEFGYNYLIQVDGACNEKTFGQLQDAGADILIVGSSGLFNYSPSIDSSIEIMKSYIEKSTNR